MAREQAMTAPTASVLRVPRARPKPWRNVSGLGVVTALALLVYYAVIFVIPFYRAIRLSFQNWDFIVEPVDVGTRNYRRALEDDYFWKALKVTVTFAVVEIAVAMILAFLVALGASQLGSRLQRFYLGLFYLPVVVPSVVSILLWRWLYLPHGGALNTVLTKLGLPEQPFLNSTDQALWCVIAFVIWSNLGGVAIILFAGINEIPFDLLEASRLDGAKLWHQTRDVILPLLKPVIFYQIVVSIIATVQMFEQFYLVMAPGFSTRTLAVYTYDLGFRTLNLGYGATVSILIFILLLSVTVLQFRRYLATQGI